MAPLIEREVAEELQAAIQSLTHLGVVENNFHTDAVHGHVAVFLYTGILDPAPADVGATLTKADGSVLPIA
ncbi:MAG: hypothetical protein LC679_06715 [Intrasporangiaceae bacterium]|nr:hypothetical protein [Intrasporangiaceae bacterium]